MSFTIRYMARLRDDLGVDQENFIPSIQCANVAELILQLPERGPRWRALLNDPSVMVALNKAMVARNSPIRSGDEIAFLPPVTGG